MNATIVAVDLAKNIFELAVADEDWRIAQRQRLTRAKFFNFFVQLQFLRSKYPGSTPAARSSR